MTTVHAALRQAATDVATVSDAPQLEAAWLLAQLLGVSTSWLHTHSDTPLSAGQATQLATWIAERQRGVPLAYILSSWEFYGRPFLVTPAVLVPRPETEQLVSRALEVITRLAGRHGRPLVVADVGCGSGCIGITLLLESDAVAQVYATDISTDALAVARRNAATHGVSSRMVFRHGHLLEPVTTVALDLVVSNPPYVPEAELAQAHTSPTRDTRGLTFEPELALAGGADGLRFVRELQKTSVPALIESVGGEIVAHNLSY